MYLQTHEYLHLFGCGQAASAHLLSVLIFLAIFFLYNISELISLKSFHFHVRSYKRGECECLFAAAVQIEVKVLPGKKTYFHSYFVGFFLLVVVVVFFISRFLLFYISVIILSINTTLFIYKNKSLTLKYLFFLLFFTSFFCEDPLNFVRITETLAWT